jgi:UDP-glucose 4-epimerase
MILNSEDEILVTGGAGFIGSHLVDKLMKLGFKTNVLDNLSSGSEENISQWKDHSDFNFIKGDCLNPRDIRKAIEGCTVVFHLAANPNVRAGQTDVRIDLDQNFIATYNILEEMHNSETAKIIVFASSSTVYGETTIIPTPEASGAFKPISLYGASKLACEAYISAYCHMFDLKGIIYRFANIIGSRNQKGVIWDFINKLSKKSKELEILGDGTQAKSYLLVEECIEAFLLGLKNVKSRLEIFNIGSEDKVSVITIAETITKLMKMEKVNFRFKQEAEGGRGWAGDVKTMLLDISKFKKLGWNPKYNSLKSIIEAAKEIIEESILSDCHVQEFS